MHPEFYEQELIECLHWLVSTRFWNVLVLQLFIIYHIYYVLYHSYNVIVLLLHYYYVIIMLYLLFTIIIN